MTHECFKMLAILSTFITLTSVATAATIPQERSIQPRISYSDYHDLKQFNITDTKEMCTPQYNTEEAALRIWWGTGAGIQLDSFIKTRGEKDWFNTLTAFVFNAGGAMDCTTLTGAGNCEIDADKCCKFQVIITCLVLSKELWLTILADLVSHGKGQFYWILKAVSIFHHITANLYQAYVQSSAISDGLRIDELINDFDVTPPPPAHVPNIFCMYISS